ncbi:NitT/TauT family transport system ATP-binding protein [Tamaricihabitans halophyticus]|uniref:NitT/TauT family transport system ATP-binding protein n=1 Tax=Tamaricihabitans halophyticus TaxID=1262583 RepID=A0A4R2QLF9_9PSEU|nr:ABC transporter ATP-binding protein [Tamaricihabitans halophyticus]TCP47835.1 NitT/TauT family transport system ATP-binding protein [Tamaricihabitans halophyticus]
MEKGVYLRGVSKKFVTRQQETVDALSAVDLAVEPGEFISLLGPSGCGKSTLLKIVAGLLPPSGGSAWLDGHEIVEPSDSVSFVFQKPTLLRWRSIQDNVLLPLDVAGSRPKEAVEYAKELLALVKLSDFANAYPSELSGGMQQRAAIARSLVSHPDVLLMDEPFGALDEFTRETLNEEFIELWQREPKTVLFVTHSIAESVFMSDRIAVMGARPGRIIDEITVPFPRPRGAELRKSKEFFDLVARIRETFDLASESSAREVVAP